MYLDLTPSSNLFYGFFGKGWKKLTITTNAEDPVITFIASPKVAMGNSVWIPVGTSVSYSISAEGYDTATGTVVVNDFTNMSVELTVTLTINPTPSNATVVLIATGYLQEGNSITVPYGTTVVYTISADGYTTVTASMMVTSTQTTEIELEPV